MRIPAATIWDTRIQSACAAVTADDEGETEFWLCGNFGFASLDPLRLVINPNRLYPIDEAIRKNRRFAVNILASSQRDVAGRLFRVRRRSPIKAAIVGAPILRHEGFHIPYLEDCLVTLFCEVERFLDSGDHRLLVARVLESTPSRRAGQQPLLYPKLFEPKGILKTARTVLAVTGLGDIARKILIRRRGASAPDLPANTYWLGGATDQEISSIASHSLKDRGRLCWPPEHPPAFVRRQLGVCVIGVGKWGSLHCDLFRRASTNLNLFVCGRDRLRTESAAHRFQAAGHFLGWEKALSDPRVQAVSIVLPHDLHSEVAQAAAAAGKHVLVEKPIATTLQQSDAMIASARRAGVILMVAENMHFRPAVRETVRAIERGDIGEPLFLQVHGGGLLRPSGWQADAGRMGGGILMDLGIHYVRVLRLIMGEPHQVQAYPGMQSHTKMTGEDNAQAVFSSSYGWRAHFFLNWAGPTGHSPDVIVSGERGVLYLWRRNPYVDLYPSQSSKLLPALLPYIRPAWLAQKLTRPGNDRVRIPVPDADLDGYLTEVREFLAAVAEQRMPVTSAEDGRRDLQIVLAAYQSMHSGQPAPIPLSPG